MGELGAGFPVYYNMHAESPDDYYAPNSYPPGGAQRNDPTLGIAIGVLLSIICIIACVTIIVWHRRQVKRNRSNAMGSPNNATTGASVVASKIGATFDQHEMETLINKPRTSEAQGFHHVLDRVCVAMPMCEAGVHIPRCNGQHDFGMPYKEEGSGDGEQSDRIVVDGDGDHGEGSSDGKYGFIFSSTPKREESDNNVPAAAVASSTDESSLISVAKPSSDFRLDKCPEIVVNSNNNVTTSTPKKPPRKMEVICGTCVFYCNISRLILFGNSVLFESSDLRYTGHQLQSTVARMS